jgi:hypothetical protein
VKHSPVVRLASILALGAALLAAPPATAAPPEPPGDILLDLPEGQACPDFALRAEGVNSNATVKEFTDKDGNTVRVITAGRGYTVTYTNLETSESLTYKANGFATIATLDPGTGLVTVRSTGHFGLIMFPTDVPAGPSTTTYVGTVVYTVDPNGVFTILSTSGTKVDVCAALL